MDRSKRHRRVVKTRPFGAAACVLACLLLIACATAPDARRAADAEGLARAESAFSAAAGVAGVKAAFLEAMADDATLFRPGPVNGPAYVAAHPDPPIRLEWRSQRVAVARSGELGFSSGPYRLASNAAPDRPSYGQFFTIWKRNASGLWQVLIDQGIGHAEASGWTSPLEVIDDEAPSPALATVDDAEARFASMSAVDGVDHAYRAFASKHIRLLREGRPPIDGTVVHASSWSTTSRWTWNVTDRGVARSGDLAWVIGRYRATDEGAASDGYFVRVWRAESGGWKILGDVLAPIKNAPD